MSIRVKLTIGFIIVIILANATLSLVTVLHIGNVLLREVQTRIRSDLNSAKGVYDDRIDNMAEFLRAASVRRSIVSPLTQGVRGELGVVLQTLREEGKMDMLTLVSARGRVIYRAHNPEQSGDDLSENPIIRKVLKDHRPASGTIIVGHETLKKEGADLASRADLEVLDTPGAQRSEKKFQSDGMVMAAAIPFVSLRRDGKVMGVLYAANLLNRRYEIVDMIRDNQLQNQRYEGKAIGTATIFQGDLRISTNVRNKDGSRAVGTRVSAEVYEHVLAKGRIWADRAFVVNDWYITSYEPIRDPDGRIIGALYVGLLEKPFAQPQRAIVFFFLGMVGFTAVASVALLLVITRMALRPVDRIVAMCRKVIGGDLTARVGICPPGEMGVLCGAIDRMAEAVADREQQLHRRTQRQIGQSEKLAAIGQLAAGTAHEINNPLTGVLTFAHLLKRKKGMSEQDKEDLEVIIQETTRVREIVRGLLDLAHESPSTRKELDLNEVIRQTMTLVRNHPEFSSVVIEENLHDGLPRIYGDKNQLQQVFLNLSLNACEAMPEGGTLSITTSGRDETVIITVSDTGHGIKAEHLDKIFDPFFTTKPVGKGTGLGLSVSYGTIEQHGGSLEVESVEGHGATFTIILSAKKIDASENQCEESSK